MSRQLTTTVTSASAAAYKDPNRVSATAGTIMNSGTSGTSDQKGKQEKESPEKKEKEKLRLEKLRVKINEQYGVFNSMFLLGMNQQLGILTAIKDSKKSGDNKSISHEQLQSLTKNISDLEIGISLLQEEVDESKTNKTKAPDRMFAHMAWIPYNRNRDKLKNPTPDISYFAHYEDNKSDGKSSSPAKITDASARVMDCFNLLSDANKLTLWKDNIKLGKILDWIHEKEPIPDTTTVTDEYKKRMEHMGIYAYAYILLRVPSGLPDRLCFINDLMCYRQSKECQAQ